MGTELLSPEQIESIGSVVRYTEAWKDVTTKAKKDKTPTDQIEEKGNFPYASFEYMETQMDKYHPRRAVHVINESYDPVAYLFMFTVEIVDLNTGECRAGTGAHPMIVYEGGGTILKSPSTIRQLMANAKKAALTEAIRDAYAHFGIAADLYGMTSREKPTDEQQERFEKTIIPLPDNIKKNLRDKWVTHYRDSVEEFIIEVQTKTSAWVKTNSVTPVEPKTTLAGGTDGK